MKIAVVIPCRNEKNNIEECINAIYASNLPANWELDVFVVDGKSDDGTLAVLEKLQQTFTTLQIVVNHAQITPKSLEHDK